MTISTKSGDSGQSQWQNQRLTKNEVNFDFVGDLDELNSFIGLTISSLEDNKTKLFLKEIQKDIMLISSLQAFNQLMDVDQVLKKLKADLKKIEEGEEKLEQQLPHQHHFILPGGCQAAALAHVTRAVCRRAERQGVKYFSSKKTNLGKKETLAFLNRLSDYLHLLARWLNFKAQVKEEDWA